MPTTGKSISSATMVVLKRWGGQTTVLVRESMKMGISVEAARAGAVNESRVRGQTVQEGETVAVLEERIGR